MPDFEDDELERLLVDEALERSFRLTNTITLRLQQLARSLDVLAGAADEFEGARAEPGR